MLLVAVFPSVDLASGLESRFLGELSRLVNDFLQDNHHQEFDGAYVVRSQLSFGVGVIAFRSEVTGQAFLKSNEVPRRIERLEVTVLVSEAAQDVRERFKERLWPETPPRNPQQEEGQPQNGMNGNGRKRGREPSLEEASSAKRARKNNPLVNLKAIGFGRRAADGAFHQEWSSTPRLAVLDPNSDYEKMAILLPAPEWPNDDDDERTTLTIPYSSVHEVYPANNSDIFLVLRFPPSLAVEEVCEGAKSKHLRRLLAIDDAHARIAPYVGTLLRLNFLSKEDRDTTLTRLRQHSLNVVIRPVKVAVKTGSTLYDPQTLTRLRTWMADLDFEIGFQLDALLLNGSIDAKILDALRPDIDKVLQRCHKEDAERVLIAFEESLIPPEGGTEDEVVELDSDGEESAPPLSKGGANCTPSWNRLRAVLVEAEKGVRGEDFFKLKSSSRSCMVTPTRYILSGPYADDSNSIVRRYNRPECFLRVSFREEHGDMFWSPRFDWERESLALFLTERVRKILREGIDIGGRLFTFLAYSSSGLKEATAIFMTDFEHEGELITPDRIRNAFDLSKVAGIPARWMARISQLFSATRPSLQLQKHQVSTVDDITSEDRKLLFTDGVGLISLELAEEVNRALSQSGRPRGITSTCYQIRLGGAKGMVSVDLSLEGSQIQLRPSMVKFHTPDSFLTLDIASTFPRPLPGYLNRPLVTILENLGIDKTVFIKLQNDMLKDLNEPIQGSWRLACKILDAAGLAKESGLSDILRKLGLYFAQGVLNSPFLDACIGLTLNHAKRDLKWKARILVKQSWNLVGVSDPGGYLEEGEIYACVHEPGKEPVYLEGLVAISRSPTVHPGDVQIARAIGKVPDEILTRFCLLENCVVFPSKGSKCLQAALGGGDLDGDLYLLIQDPRLIPSADRIQEADDYEAPQMKTLADGQTSTIEDGIDFFLEFMQNDRLGSVATTHLRVADLHPLGSLSDRCRQLATLHTTAVDYPKTGVPVTLAQLQPLQPTKGEEARGMADFLEKGTRRSHPSKNALGYLFRAVELGDERSGGGLEALKAASAKPLDPGETFSKQVAAIEAPLFLYPPQALPTSKDWKEIERAIATFSDKLRKIAVRAGGIRGTKVSEVEIFMGVLHGGLGKGSAAKEQLQAMKVQTGELFNGVRRFIGSDIRRAWLAWCVAVHVGRDSNGPWGTRAFGWLALGAALKDEGDMNIPE